MKKNFLIKMFEFLGCANYDKKIKRQYDERQLQARGNGFKYGFFTHIFYNIGLSLLFTLRGKIPVQDGMLELFGVFLAISVFVVYCMYKQAYISLNENVRNLTVSLLIAGGISLISGIMNLYKGKIIENGVVTLDALSLICGTFMIVLTIIINIIHLKQKNDTDGMEDEV